MTTLLPIPESEHNPNKTDKPKRIAILGDGQLWQMSALAAKQMWHEVCSFWQVGEHSPAGQVWEYIDVSYEEIKKTVDKILAWWADVVTTEWENIPWKLAEAIEEEGIKMYPNSRVLKIIQHRTTEKQAARDAGHNTTKFVWEINNISELRAAYKSLGTWFLKTANGWYDGKGQVKIESIQDIDNFIPKIARWNEPELGSIDRIYEQELGFDYEISVIVGRRPRWETIVYEPAHNMHKNGILVESHIPAINSESIQWKINQDLVNKAKKAAEDIATHMDVVWVIAVEMFVKDGEIFINEMAPRPHNSGHGTIESYNLSQFHAHIKAITDEDFWELRLESKSVMKNDMGNDIKDMPKRDKDGKHKIITVWGVRYYDYGKWIWVPERDYPKGRKMGHSTRTISLKK